MSFQERLSFHQHHRDTVTSFTRIFTDKIITLLIQKMVRTSFRAKHSFNERKLTSSPVSPHSPCYIPCISHRQHHRPQLQQQQHNKQQQWHNRPLSKPGRSLRTRPARHTPKQHHPSSPPWFPLQQRQYYYYPDLRPPARSPLAGLARNPRCDENGRSASCLRHGRTDSARHGA